MNKLKETYTLSIAAPAYNEADCLLEVVNSWTNYLDQNSIIGDYEIIICNDGSTDDTGLILNNLAKNNPKIKVIHFINNVGAAAALKSAIKNTQMELVFLLDSDGQFPISNFKAMLNKMVKSKCEAVIGIRKKKATIKERFGSYSSGLVANLVFKSKLNDFNSACKLVTGDVLRGLSLEAIGMNYSTEITARLLENKVSINEINIVHKQRLGGNSKMNFVKGGRDRLLFLLYLWFRSSLIKRKIIMRLDD